MNPLVRRIRRWQFHRAMQRHAMGTARALALVAQTNPTLASVTWQRIDERTVEATGRGREGFAAWIDDVTALVDDALLTERRRQEMR